MTKDWIQIEDHVHKLLDEGKRSQDPEFKLLMEVFGKEKIVKIAKDYLEKKK